MKRLLKLAAWTGVVTLAYKLGQGSGVSEAIVRLTSLDPDAGAKLRSVMSNPHIPQGELDKVERQRRMKF